ncbi:MAG: hypothetical protein LBB48_06750 [Treponema sp.]|nr:hypothetical protein [Treponema sp.]
MLLNTIHEALDGFNHEEHQNAKRNGSGAKAQEIVNFCRWIVEANDLSVQG